MPEGTGEGFEYRYDAGANVFRRIGPQIITERGVDEHRERPGKLSVVEFADIVAGALALTPKM
jgi:hypothetical protein